MTWSCRKVYWIRYADAEDACSRGRVSRLANTAEAAAYDKKLKTHKATTVKQDKKSEVAQKTKTNETEQKSALELSCSFTCIQCIV